MAPRRRTAWIAIAVVALAAHLVPGRAEAAKPREQAEAEARKACAAGRVGEGIEMLAALLTEYGHPNYIYNQARCYQQNGKSEQAISRFKEYLRASQDISPDERVKVEGFIRELEAERQAAAPPPPVAPIAEPVPAPAPIVTPATAAHPTEPVAQLGTNPSASRDEEAEVAVEPRSHGLRTAGIALGLVGAAGLVTGFVSSMQIRSLEREIETARPGSLTATKLADNEKKAHGFETLQWVGYGVGGAALAGGIVCLIMDATASGPSERAGRVRVIGTVGPGGRPGVALSGRF